LAANVSTLNAKDATEALTAAMKAFKEEGTESMRFLDAWSEVEAKHAITAEDMANAIKKSASAAKNAGFTFDELNGIVAGIGAVTRQSGKESRYFYAFYC
jgi:TP901 family phage tail tape measure protein